MRGLIVEYLDAIHEMNELEGYFEKKENVRKYNSLCKRNRKIVGDIEENHPELKQEFYQLLFSEEQRVRAWVAHHILEVMSYDDECRKSALKEIERISTYGKDAEALGNRMWLQQWLDKHPEDRSLQ